MKLMKRRTILYLSKVQKVDENGLKKPRNCRPYFCRLKSRLMATRSCLDVSKPSNTVQLKRKKSWRNVHPSRSSKLLRVGHSKLDYFKISSYGWTREDERSTMVVILGSICEV